MDFISVLKRNNNDEMKNYLFQNGKSPKPVAPFYYILKEEERINGRETVNGPTDETDTRSDSEAEITE